MPSKFPLCYQENKPGTVIFLSVSFFKSVFDVKKDIIHMGVGVGESPEHFFKQLRFVVNPSPPEKIISSGCFH